jgi:ribosomal protein S18 acetylase RimI-like enzyme
MTSIRQANKHDIPHLVQCWQAIDQYPQAERPFGGDSADKPRHAKLLLERTLVSPSAVVLVAINEQEQIIGTIAGHVFEKPAVNISHVGVIYSLWVDETERSQGVGQSLLNHLEKALRDKGAQALQVGWDTANSTAAAWWQKRGYLPYEVIASKILT